MRFLFTVLTALALCHFSFAEDVRVSKEDTQHFMGVVGYLQSALFSTDKLNTPEGVREYRDLMRVLRLHKQTVGGIRMEQTSAFAIFMWQANPWINRNLSFADGDYDGGKSTFKAAWDVLDAYSDKAISESAALRAVLQTASKAIENTSVLETVAEAPRPEEVVISDGELEAAVAFAALGLAAYPATIGSSDPERTGSLQMVDSLLFFSQFLKKDKAFAVLQHQAKKSIHAATALHLLQENEFKTALDRVVTTLEKKGRDTQYFVVQAGKMERFKAFAGMLSGVAMIAQEAAEKELPPTTVAILPGTKKSPGGAKSGPFDDDEARVVASFVDMMFKDLQVLNTHRNPADENNPSQRGMKNNAYILNELLTYLAKNPDNHLRKHFYNINPWAMRNWMQMAEKNPSTLKNLFDAVVKNESVTEWLRQIEGTNAQENMVSAPPQKTVDLSLVGEAERFHTQTFALGAVMLGIQSLSANLLNLTREGTLTWGYAQHVTKLVHKGIELLASREEHVNAIIRHFDLRQVKTHEAKEVRTAAALVANLSKVLEALTFLENGFEAIGVAAGSGPFSLEQGVRYLYELVTALQFPHHSSSGGDGGHGFCLGDLDSLGQARPK